MTWHSTRIPSLGGCLKRLSIASSLEIAKLSCVTLFFLKFPCYVTTAPHHLQKKFLSLWLCLRLPLFAWPSVADISLYIYFDSSQFYLIDTHTPFWNSALFSSTLTHDLFFIFWRSSGASNLSALPKISPSSLTNNHNSSFNSRK